jgi:large subunit ribosomal protein L32
MRRDRRRASNNNLGSVQVIACPKCKEPVMPHRACTACGHYKGREVVQVES